MKLGAAGGLTQMRETVENAGRAICLNIGGLFPFRPTEFDIGVRTGEECWSMFRRGHTATFAVLLEQEIDKKGWGSLSTRKLLAKLRASGEFHWSEATLRRDLQSDELPTLDRVRDYARALAICSDRLKPSSGATVPSSVAVSHNVSRWAVCPNKMCSSSTWGGRAFIKYAPFRAEQDDRYCRKCGTALFYTCPNDSRNPLAGSEVTPDRIDQHRSDPVVERITSCQRSMVTRRKQVLASLRLYAKIARADRARASYVYLPPGSPN